MKTTPTIALASLSLTLLFFANVEPACGQAGTWTTKAPLSTGSYGLGGAFVGGQFYAISGFATPRVAAYDPTNNSWANVAPVSGLLQYFGTAVLDGKIYVVGGDTGGGGDVASLYRFDPALNSWTTLAPMPLGARYGLGAAALNGKIYAVGGYNIGTATYLDRVEEYDPTSNTWTTKTPAPTAHFNALIGAINGKLYVAGGRDANNPTNITHCYDPGTDTWSTKAPSPFNGSGAGTVLDGRLFSFGGIAPSETMVFAYDAALDSWSTNFAPMPTGRHDLAVAANGISNKIYAVGGYKGGTFTTLEVFTPPPRPNFPAVVLSDDFNDNSIDGSKWTIDVSLSDIYGTPSVLEQNQRMEITARGYLNSVSDYVPSASSPLQITGTLTFLQVGPGDGAWIVTRSSGMPASYETDAGEVTDGVGFRVAPPNFIDIIGKGGATVSGLTVGDNTLSLSEGDAVNFTVIDDGTTLSFTVTKVGDPTSAASASATCTSSLVVNKVSFFNREYDNNKIGLDNVQVATADSISITTQPQSQTVVIGSNAVFTVTAASTAPINYQWLRNGITLVDGTKISGATTSTLTLATVVPEDAASYSVIVSNAVGSITSSDAVLTPECPVITVVPATLPDGNLGSNYWKTMNAGAWTATGAMTTNRTWHTATLLPNGKVLVAGGADDIFLYTAELYDPATGVWTQTGSLHNNRMQHTATLLPNGKVLVASGGPASAELYDPATGTWTLTGALNAARYGHTATLLPNGKVLVAGGYYIAAPLASAELYDPATGNWTPTGSLNFARHEFTATLLPNGKVLVAGGDGSSGIASTAEIYDPTPGTWTTTGSLSRYRHTATLLQNGKVLVAGGLTSGLTAALDTSLYNPTNGFWTPTGALNIGRQYHTAALLTNGKVLVIGGDAVASTAELFDPANGTWTTTSALTASRMYGQTATTLSSGDVLVAGDGSAEVYNPDIVVKLTGSGGTAPYSFAIASGSLPLGLSLASDGSLTGIPLAIGTNTFTVTVTDANGCTGSGLRTVAIQPSGSALDTNKPIVQIKSPANKKITDTAAIAVTGIAKENSGIVKTGVALVLCSLNNGTTQPAVISNVTNWTANITLQPGWNTFTAQALDYRGNASTPVTYLYFYGATANAIGKYNGLFYETNSTGDPIITEQSAGAVFNLSVSLAGSYSGRIYVGGGNYPLKGLFDLAGNTVTNILRGTKPPIIIAMHLDWSGASKQITGTVACPTEGWTSALLADLAVYSSAAPYPTPARYTMAIPPASGAPTNAPGGYGYGLITNKPNGTISLSGKLADSTSISQNVPISKDGHWPLYVNLYKNQGLLEGWLDFSSGAPTGQLTWIKTGNPTNVTLTTYLVGFTNVVQVFGSIYTPATPALNLPAALLDITDGSGLNLPLTFNVGVSNNNKIVKIGGITNALSGVVAAATGQANLTFTPTGLGKQTKSAIGVALQNSNAIYGAFIGNNDGTGKTNTGSFHLH